VTDRLTDEHVAALADEYSFVSSNCSMAYGDVETLPATIEVERNVERDASEVMRQLALEVQSARARRCQSCSKFKNWAWTEDGSGRCYGPVNGLVLPDFFCAAHTPEVPA
jgi:hypothetical protein